MINNSNVLNLILVELPTFIWFTASTLVVLLWVSVTSTRKQKAIGKIFRQLFVVVNGLMWALFILFIILFIVLPDTTDQDPYCIGRLAPTVNHTPRRVLFIVYQVFLATVALLLSFSFLFFGLRVYFRQTAISATSKKGRNSRKDEIKLLVLCLVCAFSFAAHAVFLLVLGAPLHSLRLCGLLLTSLRQPSSTPAFPTWC